MGGFTDTCSPCDPLPAAELFTQGSGSAYSFAETAGKLSPGRRYFAAVDYMNQATNQDQVAIFGGWNLIDTITTFDPSSQAFTNVIPMNEQRDYPTAALVHDTNSPSDNQILIAGGVSKNSGTSNGQQLELYNPATQGVSDAGLMNTARTGLTTTLFGLTTDSLSNSVSLSAMQK